MTKTSSTYDQTPAHGTLSGFVSGDCRCDCCCAAFNAHIIDSRNLFIFAPNFPWARAWAIKHRLAPIGYQYMTGLGDTYKLMGRTNGYYVVLGDKPVNQETLSLLVVCGLTKLSSR